MTKNLGRIVIYGPPGTGKTTALIKRMKNQLRRGTPPDRILFCSFTRTAAKEIAARLDVPIKASTLHSVAFEKASFLKEQVLDKTKLQEFKNLTGIRFSENGQGEIFEGDSFLQIYSVCLSKNNCLDYGDVYDRSYMPGTRAKFLYFCETYSQWKKDRNYVDFNDMILKACEGDTPSIDALFIDEAQDLSPLQWRLVNHWKKEIPFICIAGDDDQELFQWGGADASYMKKFSKEENAEIIVLKRSYRVPKKIHGIAQALISNLKSNRIPKDYEPRKAMGSFKKLYCIDFNELPLKKGADTLILYRNHSTRDAIEWQLIEKCIPYLSEDKKRPSPLQKNIFKAMCVLEAFLRDPLKRKLSEKHFKLLKLHMLSTAFQALSEDPKRLYLSPILALFKIPMGNNDLSFYYRNLIRSFGSLKAVKTEIRLSTIHNAKGREAENVVLLLGMNPRTYKAYLENPDPDIKVFYVAVTRAKKSLFIISSGENQFDYL